VKARNRLIVLNPTRNTHLMQDRFISGKKKMILLVWTQHLLRD